MFDISWGELLLLAALGVVFIRPDDLPAVMRVVVKAFRQVKRMAEELRDAFDDLAEESGIKDEEREWKRTTRMITGDDGTLYEAHEVEALDELPRHKGQQP